MGELGSQAALYHQEIGEYALQAGVNKLIAVGEYASDVGLGYGLAAAVYQNNESLIADLGDLIDDDDVVLVKGSRSSKMENIVNLIVERL